MEGHYYVRDLGSTNGTKVNGTRISDQPRRIFVGDRIRLSSTVCVKLRVQDATEEQMQQALYALPLQEEAPQRDARALGDAVRWSAEPRHQA